MASNYVSQNNTAQPPAPAPSPGTTPTISIPAGTDVSTIESITQQMKANADYVGYVNSSVRVCPPLASVSASSGFTAVTTAGGWTGTVTPSGGVKIASGLSFVIKIIVGGAVGTATFQTSMDGGNTYGGPQTTSASMTDATSGITLAFTGGPFTANGTAQFRGAYTPVLALADVNANIHSLFDHDGFPMGRRSEARFEWAPVVSMSSSGLSTTDPRWTGTISGASSSISGTGVGSGGLLAASGQGSFALALCTTGTGATDKAFLTTTGPYFPNPTWTAAGSPFSSLVLTAEWEAAVTAFGVNTASTECYFGFTSNGDFQANSTTADWTGFYVQPAATPNWKCFTNQLASGAINSIDSGVAATAYVEKTSGVYKFKVKLYGSSSYRGAIALFFINDALVTSTTTKLPSGQSLSFALGVANNSSTTLDSMIVGPVYCTWNRYSSQVL